MKDRNTPTEKLRDLIRQVIKEEMRFEFEVYDIYPESVCEPAEIRYELRAYLNNDTIHRTTYTHYK